MTRPRPVKFDERLANSYRQAQLFLRHLRKYVHKLDNATICELRRQALNGDIDGAEERLAKLVKGTIN